MNFLENRNPKMIKHTAPTWFLNMYFISSSVCSLHQGGFSCITRHSPLSRMRSTWTLYQYQISKLCPVAKFLLSTVTCPRSEFWKARGFLPGLVQGFCLCPSPLVPWRHLHCLKVFWCALFTVSLHTEHRFEKRSLLPSDDLFITSYYPSQFLRWIPFLCSHSTW